DVDVIAPEQADVVVRRVLQRQVADRDAAALLERDQLRPAARAPVPIDPPRPVDGELLSAAPLQEGKAEVGGLSIRERLVAQLLVRIEIRVVGAGDEDRAGRQAQCDPAPEVQGTGDVLSRRKEDDTARRGAGDRGLDGGGILGLALAACAVFADGALDRSTGGRNSPRGDPPGGEEADSSQKGSPREIRVALTMQGRCLETAMWGN